jgi:hypothetical protein
VAIAGATSKITKASGPAPDSEHEEAWLRIGSPLDVDGGKLRADFVPMGDWHLHPRGGGRPSEADREAWVDRLGSPALRSWVSVIVSRPHDLVPWHDARLTGWVTYRDPAIGRHVIERAKIAVEESKAALP